MKTKSLITVALLFITIITYAGTFYVGETGNDDESGTQINPWRTLQYACENVDAGDTVIVLKGDYDGFYMTESGSSTNPIVFLAQSNVTITNKNATTNDAINLEGASYIVIEGFNIKNPNGNITRAGIRSVINEGVIIRNNTIDNMGRWGIFSGFSEDIIIEYNSCSNSQDEHGIYVSNSADNPIVRFNTCFSNNGGGIQLNADASMGDDGIITNALIDGNILYDNGEGGGSAINLDGVQESIIQNNFLYHNHASGISLFMIDGAEGSKNNLIINNTIIMADDGRWAININSESTGNMIYNNILFSEHSFRGGLSTDESSLSDLKSDYNVVIDRFSTDWGDTRLTLEEWRNETEQDMHSIISSPEETFFDYPSQHFSLAENSPGIDNGTNSKAPAYDIELKGRPFNEITDIGAYEYGGSPVTYKIRKQEEQTKIFPLPAHDYVIIESEFPISGLELIDCMGRVIQKIENINAFSYRLNFSSYDSNLNYLKIYLGYDTLIKSVIRQ